MRIAAYPHQRHHPVSARPFEGLPVSSNVQKVHAAGSRLNKEFGVP